MSGFVLWVAQGFGAGRAPFGPGTVGSLVGLLWFLLLVATGNFWLFLLGAGIGAGVSVWICGAAEKILRQADPPSVVLDEIIAVPCCFLVWLASAWFSRGVWPSPESFFSGERRSSRRRSSDCFGSSIF